MELFSILAFLFIICPLFTVQCPVGWKQAAADPNKCYLFVAEGGNWFDAEGYCSKTVAGSHLTSISSAFENTNIFADANIPALASCPQLWIGATDFDQNGQFTWSDGQPFTYSSWGPGQPNPNNQCASFTRGTRFWKADLCSAENCFICEMYMSSSGSTTTSPSTTSTTTRASTQPPMTDCYDWLHYGGVTTSGVQYITPNGSAPFEVYCDMTTNGGGWTVIQRRLDAGISFFDKKWEDYKYGFGPNLTDNHWLGNDKIHKLSTKDSSVTLRIEIRGDRCQTGVFPGVCLSQPDRNVFVFGEYRSYIDGESNQYMMHTSDILAGNMTTPGKNGFSDSNGKMFATVDHTNGNTLLEPEQLGAWWFDPGTYCALNGKYNSLTWGIYFNRRYGTLDYDIVPVSTEIKLRRN